MASLKERLGKLNFSNPDKNTQNQQSKPKVPSDWEKLSEEEKNKRLLKGGTCMLGSGILGAVGWALNGFNTKKGTAIANNLYDECRRKLK